jgi:hypothetical protein
MIFRIVVLWVLGMIILIPLSLYRLLFNAQPEEYAFLIVAPLFWVFGFWGAVGPLLAAQRIRRLMKALEKAQDAAQARAAWEENGGDEAAVNLIASENRLPKFLARWLYHRVKRKLLPEESADQRSTITRAP